MKNQKKDILLYLAFIRLCRKYEWLLKIPIGHLLQRSHKILCRKGYFMEVMKLIGKNQKRTTNSTRMKFYQINY